MSGTFGSAKLTQQAHGPPAAAADSRNACAARVVAAKARRSVGTGVAA